MTKAQNNTALQGPLIVFDGVCVLCNRWVNFMCRYQWFGKADRCRVPNLEEVNRFIG